MKRPALAISACLLLVLNIGCLKSNSDPCTPVPPASEQTVMINYEVSNGINATVHPSGLHYEIITPGGGDAPDLTKSVSVTYIGKLLDGTIFDSRTTPLTYPLKDFITGWQIGLPLIREGGSIKLVVPSSLAYGCGGAGVIPPNSVLYFEITLVDVL